MSPQEFWLLADDKQRDQVAGAGGLTNREIEELTSMLEADPKPKGKKYA